MSERAGGPGASADPLGSASHEAARLLDALGQWLGARTADTGAWSEHIATGSAECRLCPLCRLIALALDTSPELAGHLDDALRSVGSALRLVGDQLGAGSGDRRRSGEFETIVIN
jgi:hypothetical protein